MTTKTEGSCTRASFPLIGWVHRVQWRRVFLKWGELNHTHSTVQSRRGSHYLIQEVTSPQGKVQDRNMEWKSQIEIPKSNNTLRSLWAVSKQMYCPGLSGTEADERVKLRVQTQRAEIRERIWVEEKGELGVVGLWSASPRAAKRDWLQGQDSKKNFKWNQGHNECSKVKNVNARPSTREGVGVSGKIKVETQRIKHLRIEWKYRFCKWFQKRPITC